ncbi:MAG TPA: NUDIX domain-containing protein [Pseudonocardiaceae bacterium]|jgi:ADP-ribose pyrophosphatase YjhB (NUDIX family)|nr:NUDIX domain-containing protein [Pseudonocardiaceae bacterium]
MGLDARPVNLRCSALVLREDTVLLCQRINDWVLPGGTPRVGESVAACVRREVREETGLDVNPVSVAFVLDATNPKVDDHLIEVVMLAQEEGEPGAAPQTVEDGLLPRFIALDHLPRVDMLPPIGGYIRAFHGNGRMMRTAAYLGNVWRPRSATARRNS